MIFTKRAAIKKKNSKCKLMMLCNWDYMNMIEFLAANKHKELAYYHFMSSFESSVHSGESGAHTNVLELEVAKHAIVLTPSEPMWPISVTLNISLSAYRKMRKTPVYRKRRERISAVPMPDFREMKKDD